jgi:hypothetical protein
MSVTSLVSWPKRQPTPTAEKQSFFNMRRDSNRRQQYMTNNNNQQTKRLTLANDKKKYNRVVCFVLFVFWGRAKDRLSVYRLSKNN